MTQQDLSHGDKAFLQNFDGNAAMQGTQVEYLIGETSLGPITAIPGTTKATVIDPTTGVATEVEVQNWLIKSESLKVDGVKVEPARGHFVVWAHDGVVDRFAVGHPDPNTKVCRRRDPKGLLLRFHAVLMDSPAV